MEYIVLCGVNEEEQFCSILSQYGTVVYIGEERIAKYAQHAYDNVFIVISYGRIPRLDGFDGILIIGDKVTGADGQSVISGKTVPVFQADNSTAARILKNTECAAISCGMSSQDTVSISSITDRKICLSLQREIETLHGCKIDEGEIILHTEQKCTPFVAAAACVSLLLCG